MKRVGVAILCVALVACGKHSTTEGDDNDAGYVDPTGDAGPQPSADYLFDETVIRTYNLTIDPVDWQWLNDNAQLEQYVTGELEFEAASKSPQKTRLVFLLDKNALVPFDRFRDTEYGDRQERFRAHLADSGVMVQPFKDARELESLIFQALIEIDGEEAIDWLEAVYLGASDRDPDAVLEVVKALSVHGAREQSRLRGRIAESYGTLIEAHPSLAGWAARDLTAWEDWRFAVTLNELRGSRRTMDGATA